MKTLSIASFGTKVFVAILAVASLSAAAHAQFKTPVQVDVPFAFESGKQHLSAGVYTIQMDSEYVLRVQGKTVSGASMSLATRSEDLNPAKTSKVVFKKYGNRYILSQVWIAGAVDHRELLSRKAQKQLQEASNTVAPVNVELALVELPR